MVKTVCEESQDIQRVCFTIPEFCNYLGIGETKARELIRQPRNGFAYKIGSKWYVHKERLDKWILEQCDNN